MTDTLAAWERLTSNISRCQTSSPCLCTWSTLLISHGNKLLGILQNPPALGSEGTGERSGPHVKAHSAGQDGARVPEEEAEAP